MECININTLIKNSGPTERKGKTNDKLDDNDNSFSKVISNKLAKAEDKTEETKTQDMNDEHNKPMLRDFETETDMKNENHVASEKTDDQLMQLIQMLYNAGTTSSVEDIDKLKQMLSKLLSGSMDKESSDIKTKIVALDLNALKLNNINADELNSSKVLASKIVDNLVNDSSFREQLISKLNNVFELKPNDDKVAFKEAIIKELSSLVKREGKLNDVNSLEIKKLDVLNNLEPAEKVQASEKTYIKANEGSMEDNNSKEIQSNSKPTSKEDKLLKDLLSNSDTKGTKENITDKIANVVTRFETLNSDKPANVETPITISKSNFDMDFIKAVKFMDTNNLKELSVKILPKELGEIVIRLSMDNGVMKANITAANKETYNLLNSQLPAISSQLTEQNMNIQSFNLSLYNGDNFLFSGNGSDQGERRQKGRKGAQVDGIDSDEPLTHNYNIEDSNINALA